MPGSPVESNRIESAPRAEFGHWGDSSSLRPWAGETPQTWRLVRVLGLQILMNWRLKDRPEHLIRGYNLPSWNTIPWAD